MDSSLIYALKKLSIEQFILLSKMYAQVDFTPAEARQILPLIQSQAELLLGQETRETTVKNWQGNLSPQVVEKMNQLLAVFNKK